MGGLFCMAKLAMVWWMDDINETRFQQIQQADGLSYQDAGMRKCIKDQSLDSWRNEARGKAVGFLPVGWALLVGGNVEDIFDDLKYPSTYHRDRI